MKPGMKNTGSDDLKIKYRDLPPKTWLTMNLTERQLAHMKWLCRYHLETSENKAAMEMSRKLLFCLDRWPIPQ